MTRTLVFILGMLMMACGAAMAAEDTSPAPMVITARSLSADRLSGIARFKGEVEAKSDIMTLHADRMDVYYDGLGGVERIEAFGAVKLIKEGQVLTSEEAVYTAADETMVLTGNPKAVEGSSVLTGSRMVYLLREERFLVDESKVYIEPRQDNPPVHDQQGTETGTQ